MIHINIAIIGLIILILIREYSFYQHDKRKDTLISELTDKIKARDFTEYREAIEPVRTYEPVSKSDQDMYYQEIEDSKQ